MGIAGGWREMKDVDYCRELTTSYQAERNDGLQKEAKPAYISEG